jgi:hypothetical protein
MWLRESKVFYFDILLREACAILVKRITDLRRTVSSSSMTNSFYLHFRLEDIDERQFYVFCLALGGYIRSGSYYEEGSIEDFLISELYLELRKCASRFKECKFFKFFELLILVPANFSVQEDLIPSIREYDNNYRSNPERVIPRKISARFITPRKVKRQEFRRGYRDHGSMSDESTRARRKANTLNEKRGKRRSSYTSTYTQWFRPLRSICSINVTSTKHEIRPAEPAITKSMDQETRKAQRELRRRRKILRQKLISEMGLEFDGFTF